ncbi:MAG: hypothetical protein AABO58_19030 [Acidobacteriota bacterium]
MKRLFIAMLLVTTAAFAQEKKVEPEYNTTREFKNKVFEVKNRDPRIVAQSVKLLGSGFKGSDLSTSTELKTITVRDFPENVAAIEDAIKRLDRPVEISPDAELKVWVLIAGKSPMPGAPLPDELAPVVKQLQTTLRYSHYGLMTAAVQRTKAGDNVTGSGVAEPTLLGMTANEERPIFYSYRARDVRFTAGDRPSVELSNFNFAMRVPVSIGNNVQYESVGFETSVSLRDKEKVVIGTTTMRDKALIVVLTATIDPKP